MRILPLFLFSTLASASPDEAVEKVKSIPDIIAFWNFSEDQGAAKVSLVNPELVLEEQNGPIKKVEDGPFGTALQIKGGQWLAIPRAKIGPLNIHGSDAQVTVVGWIERESKSYWQTVAGVWDESRKKRQYCLFLNGAKQTDYRTMTRVPCTDRFQGHVSAVGGPSPGESFCISYSTSGDTVPMDGWQMLAMSYDGKESRVYLNGKLSAVEGSNPFPYDKGLFDGGENGGDFTVGSVNVGGKPGNFLGARLGGVAVFKRALTPEEFASLPR